MKAVHARLGKEIGKEVNFVMIPGAGRFGVVNGLEAAVIPV